MIKAVIFDIDGILTNGEVSVDANGKERKSFNLREIDALNDFKNNGLKIAAITAEQNAMTSFFEHRFAWDRFYSGYKDKVAAIKEFEGELKISSEDICYIGDGKYDIGAIKYSGLGICPRNACIEAKESADIVLKSYGGSGCIDELFRMVMELNQGNSCNYSLKRFIEHKQIIEYICLDNEFQEQVMCAAQLILRAVKNGNAIYFCGNGGSAADSQHIATEFVSRFYKERKAINAEALTVNTSSLTAITNDYSFDKIFERQLEAKGKKGDILVGITTSGNSDNVWKAFSYANKNGIKTVLLTGIVERIRRDKKLVDCLVAVPSDITPRIQEIHILVGHIWAEYIEEEMI